MLLQMVYFILFYGQIVFHRVYVPHLYPFICHWTLRLLPCLGCCLQRTLGCMYLFELHLGSPCHHITSLYVCPGVGLKDHKLALSENEMVGWHHWLDGHEFDQAPGVGGRQGGLVCCSSWGRKESDMTERLNWYFWTVELEKTLESPLDCKEIQPINPKGNQS